ncbi:fatty-acyl-CoA synthase [Williamsia muralis]|uniref:Fatty-acyl-CoA synthase n=1 Tax=Williamsia marianensis TaxID=85044 RepID=A0A495JZH4_WILMA|nr:AMP-binding protein [Williamsia muralis]RKR94393.1 fatty-acyl-CoA synthase [Williamsia muralis]
MSKLNHVRTELAAVRELRRAGAMPGVRQLPQVARLRRAAGEAAGPAIYAAIHGSRVALIDPQGPVTYSELAAMCNAVMNGLGEVLPGQDRPTVGVMCRNSRFAVIGLLSGIGLGARVVLLNTDLGAKQMAEVTAREKADVILHDAEFAGVLELVDQGVRRYVAWTDQAEGEPGPETLDHLISSSSTELPRAPQHQSSLVILTSGSTGAPKGAPRDGAVSMSLPAGFVSKIQIRGSDTVLMSAPAFHGWGLLATMVCLLTGATVVMDRRFRAPESLSLLVEHRCTAMMVVPTMLRRFMDLDEEQLRRIDHGRLRMIASGGAKLDSSLVLAVAERFGPVLHNLYGATEASYVTIATPDDLAAEPTTAGRPPLGVEVAIIRDGARVPTGESGQIFVRSGSQISKYTNGTSKETLHGMLNTGDTGRLDAAGRLFVEGRSDGMIISGGENVFPEEVELALGKHPDIVDAAVVAVPDQDFGQRLRAFVVPRDGADVAAADVKTYIGTELSRSRVPRDVIVVPDLPRGAQGKVTKTTLDALAQEHNTA